MPISKIVCDHKIPEGVCHQIKMQINEEGKISFRCVGRSSSLMDKCPICPKCADKVAEMLCNMLKKDDLRGQMSRVHAQLGHIEGCVEQLEELLPTETKNGKISGPFETRVVNMKWVNWSKEQIDEKKRLEKDMADLRRANSNWKERYENLEQKKWALERKLTRDFVKGSPGEDKPCEGCKERDARINDADAILCRLSQKRGVLTDEEVVDRMTDYMLKYLRKDRHDPAEECREMKWLEYDGLTHSCPDCGSRCSAITLRPGLEVCEVCQTVAMIPSDRERWFPNLPMKADYEIYADGSKKLLGWHPASKPEECFLKKKDDYDAEAHERRYP